MRIVVTGVAGFLGSHLAERLLLDGHSVIGVDNYVTGLPRNVGHLSVFDSFSFVEHDVTLPLYFDEKIDGILHFASPASPVDYLELPIQTLKVGSLGTHNMLGMAREKGARFLLASTSEVYGDPHVHPQPETYWGNVNPVGPRGVYDEAKRFAEAITMAYQRYHGVETGIARIFNTYGPRMRPGDGRVVSNFIVQALQGDPITVYGKGEQTRSFCHVHDAVEGIVRLFYSDYVGPVNIGNQNEYTILQLAEMVLEETKSTSPLNMLRMPVDDPKVRRPDISLARELFGWEATVSLREGIRKTLPYFKREVESRNARARTILDQL
ncbi:MAG TPA: NAD-dependent dehydratase [Gemmatimonadetes bacterium]|nr:NAD-dependent dehydratase [Gemmatimonadota bacterium]HAT38324.1 NAD-dependent dehydratase [Gemmatimonadota bacterium]HBV06837.1 NAD-dependent dehydratase [Gemmatimonadota bacterium]